MGISLDIYEDSFVKKSTSSYNLSALVGADRFIFLGYDQQFQKVQVLRSYRFSAKEIDLPASIHQAYNQDDLLKAPFQKRNIAILNTQQSLVPGRLFKPENLETYLDKLTRLDPDDVCMFDTLVDLDIKNVYRINKGVKTLLEGYFPGVQLYHATTWLINGAKELAKHRSGHQIYLNIIGNQFQMVLFEDQDLLFSNAYTFNSAQDFIYFTLLIFDQFKLKPESVPLYLSGEIVENSEIYKLIYRYIRHIHFVQLPDFLSFGDQIKAVPNHQFYNLFSAKICV